METAPSLQSPSQQAEQNGDICLEWPDWVPRGEFPEERSTLPPLAMPLEGKLMHSQGPSVLIAMEWYVGRESGVVVLL